MDPDLRVADSSPNTATSSRRRRWRRRSTVAGVVLTVAAVLLAVSQLGVADTAAGTGAPRSDGPHAGLLHRGRRGRVGLRAARSQRHHRRAFGDRRTPSSRTPVPIGSAARTASRSTASTPTHRSPRLKPRPAEWEHLGFLGPVIHAEVGDTIKSCSATTPVRRPAFTRTASSTTRTPRARRTPTAPRGADRADDAVPPGATYTYVWRCPSAPAPARWTAAPCCGCTTRTPTRSATPTPA